ncbi:hypothetical protein PSHT_03147 [Puccinia striiformis]|uniref:GDP-mannose 4,6-dehydratase n=1 Tax=Puccinia striiformis TaxID=27350 RepID=A0A2S4WGB4_9BASI|nr:hypothetical protein PSHT_03147 [Puccinia striiformis]
MSSVNLEERPTTATSTTNESPYHYAPRFGQPISLGSTISPEDYRKRKVALITVMVFSVPFERYLDKMDLILLNSYSKRGTKYMDLSDVHRVLIPVRIEHLYKDVHERPKMVLHYGDLTDTTNLVYIISQTQPTEVYNLAAQSHVKVSFDMAEYTGDVDGLGTLRLLDAIRTSPYGVAKLYAFWIVKNYRESYDMFACNGILFNHESPRRGRTFVTRKISRAVAEISLGQQECLYLGNLSAKRDWGHAKDYVEGMWKMLQQDQPDDFVLATGETHPVREFVEKAFAVVNIKIKWQGELDSVNETGINGETGKVVVRVDPMYFRPAEVELLHGLPTKAETQLGWKRTVDFDSLIREMVEADLIGARAADRN